MAITAGLLGKSRLDPDNDPSLDSMLDNLQGNILKGHGRDFSVHIFLGFTADATVSAAAVATLSKFVTSMATQLKQTKLFKEFGIPGGLFGNLAISGSGYKKLAVPLPSSDPYLTSGMRAKAGDFNDPPPDCLEASYQKSAIDLVLLLADDDEGYLKRQTAALLTSLPAGVELIAAELGAVLRNEAEEGIEHFNYVDGRSQPIYFESDRNDEIDAQTGANVDKWDPSEPLNRVLVVDPLAPTTAVDALGSLMVFRKLEQNVQSFKMRELELANSMGLTGDDRERAGAMVVGRFEDGTPLVLSQVDGLIPKKDNNFTYADDPAGLKCPFHAHIRKSNPRGDTVRKLGSTDAAERSRRITRRAIPYGAKLEKPTGELTLSELPTGDVGLLFVCFQASIEQQFAFIQKSWVNNEGFVQPNTGIDPIIGQTPGGNDPTTFQTWMPNYGAPSVAGPQPQCPLTPARGGPTKFDFSRFVTFKGGEFFFAPSIPFLMNIAAVVAHPPVVSGSGTPTPMKTW